LKKTGFNSEEFNVNEELAVPIMAFGILIIFIGCLGCATCKFKNPCFAVPFGALNFIFALLLLIMASFALGGKEVQEALYSGVCTKENKSGVKLNAFDKMYKENVDNLMCTTTCPCKPKDKDAKKSYPFTMNDKYLRERFGRTKGALSTAEQTDYDTNGSKAAIVPLIENDVDGYETF